jgi:hypothetical protein
MTTDETPPDAVPRTYSDGHPLDQIHYREYKLILRPARFGSPRSFAEFSKLVRHAAEQLDVALYREERSANQLREVLFFDTPAFDLYENAFILRRRTTYRDGWPLDDHDLVLKFRHQDADTAARVDMRPAGLARYEMKFKEELLTPRDGLGGLRSLFSHNCTLESPPPLRDRPFDEVAAVFPALRRLGCKFERYAELHQKAKKRADEFFHTLQLAVPEWVQLNATKTSVIYGTGRTPVTNRE